MDIHSRNISIHPSLAALLSLNKYHTVGLSLSSYTISSFKSALMRNLFEFLTLLGKHHSDKVSRFIDAYLDKDG